MTPSLSRRSTGVDPVPGSDPLLRVEDLHARHALPAVPAWAGWCIAAAGCRPWTA